MVWQSRYLKLNAFNTQKTVSMSKAEQYLCLTKALAGNEMSLRCSRICFFLPIFSCFFMLDIRPTAIVEHKYVPAEET